MSVRKRRMTWNWTTSSKKQASKGTRRRAKTNREISSSYVHPSPQRLLLPKDRGGPRSGGRPTLLRHHAGHADPSGISIRRLARLSVATLGRRQGITHCLDDAKDRGRDRLGYVEDVRCSAPLAIRKRSRNSRPRRQSADPPRVAAGKTGLPASHNGSPCHVLSRDVCKT